MDSDQRRNAPEMPPGAAALRGPTEPPAEAADAPVASDARDTALLLRRTPPPATGAPASILRKEQVRAALFRKLEPIRVGRFILLEQLGAGAMGEIYAAYDDQLDRKVALKLVKGSAGHRKGDERLLREAQTLARLSHPNVVQVYEAGTYNGRLFIAMELIRGKTLTSWLQDAEQVPRAVRQREILRQFIAAGRGLEAAHAADLAHRDFKPDNVLVGDDGRVRVVDFGLARALMDEPEGGAPTGSGRDDEGGGPARRGEPFPKELELMATLTSSDAAAMPPAAPARATAPAPAPSVPKLKAALRLTETGTVMGTPRYMAPEQLRGAVADPRSDQFSFCVALYHALCGEYPFAGDTWQELQASIESGEVRPALNVPVPAFVRGALRRGLAVDPSQRFPGMGELLAALEPRSRRVWVWSAAAAALVAAGLGAGVYARSNAQVDPCADAGAAIDAPWAADRQATLEVAFRRSELPFAEAAWRGVKTRIDDYAGRWRTEATAACRATNVAHTQSAQQLDKRMLCLDRGRRQLAALVAELGAGAPGAVEHAVEATEALPALEACGDATNLLFGLEPPPAPAADKVAAIRDQVARAHTLELLGRSEEALAVAREASAAAGGLGYPPVHAEALFQTASAVSTRGTGEARGEAERLCFEALDMAEAARHDELAAQIWNQLVRLAVDSDKEQALAWWRRNEAAVRRLGDNAYEEAQLHHLRAAMYYSETKYTQSADEERRAIAAIERAPAHRLELSRYYNVLALSLVLLDQHDEALRLHDRAVAIAGEVLGTGHPELVKFQANYGVTLRMRGQLDRAISVLEGALASMSARDRESNREAARIHSYLSAAYNRKGLLDRAAEHARVSLEIHRRARSPDSDVAQALVSLGNVEFQRRDFNGAIAQYEEALALQRHHLQDDNRWIGSTEGNIAEALAELGRYDEALPHLATAEHIFERGATRWTRGWILAVRGEILAGKRQLTAAIPVLERALELFDEHEANPTSQIQAMWTLARALHELGRDGDRVRSLAERAHALLAAQGATTAHQRDAIARFIDQLPARKAPGARTR
jgi:serine/threonine protein kinase/tetratricopeptide (TPR) repeat protein